MAPPIIALRMKEKTENCMVGKRIGKTCQKSPAFPGPLK
jgi:hypothetical protein